MRPQLQKFRGSQVDGQFGDCYRTCVAMILNMDRDDVPHFAEDVPPGTPGDDPLTHDSFDREREWAAQHGLSMVSIPFPGEVPLETLLEQFGGHGRPGAAPVILNCSLVPGGAPHAVVMFEQRIYDPLGLPEDWRRYPTPDGFWWVQIYTVGANWMPRFSTRAIAFRAGFEHGFKAGMEHLGVPFGNKGQDDQSLEDAWEELFK
jgi:hypothetical protein